MVAAFNAVSRIDDFACIPEQSISSGIMTCIAQNRGAGEHERVGETFRCGMSMEAVYGVLICLIVLAVKTPVMRLFAAQDSVSMIGMGVDYLTLMAFFYILPGLTNGIQGYFRGMGEMENDAYCDVYPDFRACAGDLAARSPNRAERRGVGMRGGLVPDAGVYVLPISKGENKGVRRSCKRVCGGLKRCIAM